MQLCPELVEECVRRALREDLGETGDVTTALALCEPRACRARIHAKAAGVVAGLPLARAAFLALDAGAEVEPGVADGGRVDRGDLVLTVRGDAAAILGAERTALNFLARLSGIATLTRAFVDAVAGTGARILDTRKTTPTLRALEKYAVRAGGGHNHRHGLFDQVLLKENHFACARGRTYRDVVEAVARAGAGPAIAEARTLDQAVDAVRGGAGVVLLDNFVPGPALRAAVDAVRGAAEQVGRAVEVEVSGGIVLDNVARFAACGVDRISVGALTHSAEALDLSLLVEALV